MNMAPCVCVSKSLRTCPSTSDEDTESQDGEVCVRSYTPFPSLPTYSRSSSVVLHWYQTTKLTNKFSTTSGTTVGVVR